MDKKDFSRTESYSLRLRPTGARKVTEEFNSVINIFRDTYYPKEECGDIYNTKNVYANL